MNKIKIIIIVLFALVLQGCCFAYQPKVVDKIMQPFSKEIKLFYSNHKNYPNNKELKDLLAKINWKRINVSDDFECNNYKCRVGISNIQGNRIFLKILYKNTLCNYSFENNTIEKNRELSSYMKKWLKKLAKLNSVENIRQTGMVAALDIKGYKSEDRVGLRVYQYALSKGVLLRPLGNTIYFMPPYIITKEQLDVVFQSAYDILKII